MPTKPYWPPEPSDSTRHFASYVAMVIRNAMEDFHHKYLSDEQMKELNPIIRNAVCTALHAFEYYDRLPRATQFVDFHFVSIPKYWEKPELLEDYRRLGEES